MREDGWTVSVAPSAARDLADLPPVPQRRVARAIDGLVHDPRPPGARLLVGGSNQRVWRLRVGDYRILYEVRDRDVLVLIIRIGHRRDVYR